jgi:hypothetical protein
VLHGSGCREAGEGHVARFWWKTMRDGNPLGRITPLLMHVIFKKFNTLGGYIAENTKKIDA